MYYTEGGSNMNNSSVNTNSSRMYSEMGRDRREGRSGMSRRSYMESKEMNKDKSEKMDHWFAGFYPAENPQYTVVVLQDEQTQPATGCAAIFAEVCNAIYLLKSN